MPAPIYPYNHILSLLTSCSSCWAIVPLTLGNNGILNRWHYWASAHVCHKIMYHAFMEQGSTCAVRLCIVVTPFDKCSTRLRLWFRAFWSCVCGHTWDWGILSVVSRHEWYYWCFGWLLLWDRSSKVLIWIVSSQWFIMFGNFKWLYQSSKSPNNSNVFYCWHIQL